MFLEKMAALKKEEIHQRKAFSSLEKIKDKIARLPPPKNLLDSIRKSLPLALIAEIKQASPSAGTICEGADLPLRAKQYEEGGACAISVLTEGHFFHGSLIHLHQVKAVTSLPVLQKDFIIDPLQIYEGRAAGADAVLLIAAMLERSRLEDLFELARGLGLVPLVEVHDEEDLAKVPGLHLPLMGINNRNLKTLEVDLATTPRLISKMPRGTPVISESGIQKRQDVEGLQEAGVQGILVGEILMRSASPANKIRELLGL